MLKTLLDMLGREDIRYLLGLSLGLTEYEVKALASLSGGVTSPRKVGSAAGIPRAKTYEVLERLVEKGFAVRSEGKPVTYSLKRGVLEEVAHKVEKRSASLVSALRRLEEVRRAGLKRVVEGEVRSVLGRGGLKEVEVSEDEGFIAAESPQGFRIMVVLPREDSLQLDVRRISEWGRSRGVRLVLVMVSEENAANLRVGGVRGVRFVEFGKEDLQVKILDFLRELEMVDREFEERRAKFEGGLLAAKNSLSECASLLAEADRFLRERRGDIHSEDFNMVSSRLKNAQDDLLRHNVQIMSLEKIGAVLVADSKRHGVAGEDAKDLERLVEDVRSVEELLKETRKIVSSMYGEVREAVERRVKLGFAPLSAQPPDAPGDEDVVGQKRLKRGLEEFVWSSKGLGGLSCGMLRGERGGGKTLLLRCFMGRVNRGDFGSAVAAYTPVQDTFLDTYNALASALSSSAMISDMVSVYPRFEGQKTFVDIMGGFRRSVEAFQNQGVMNIYWFIDDLDRLLKIPDDKRKVFMRELQVFIEDHANTPIAILFASTSAAFEKLESEYPEVFSLIPRSSVLTIPPFELEDLKELVSRSLTKTEGEHSALLKPDDEALRLLLSMSGGNPRKIIQILNEAFYISSKTGRHLSRTTLKDLVSK